jgi:hypothetical protein
MLSHTTMGYVALFVLWGNTLLVALAALSRAGKLWRRRAQLGPVEPRAGARGLVRARVDGEGSVAELCIEQVGRYGAGEPRSVLWHDRRAESQVLGGEVVAGAQRFALDAEAPAQVWPKLARAEELAACKSGAEFDEVWPMARKARGHTRKLSLPIEAGDEVHVAGRFEERSGALVLTGDADEPMLVSTIEPRALLLSQVSLLAFVFVPAILLGAGLVTAIALWPPVLEGTVSKIGGLLAFGYFLIVLPAGTAARDRTLLPHERPLRGRWVDPSPKREAAAKASSASADEAASKG